jgi:mono/diheme cytochrome c family protein
MRSPWALGGGIIFAMLVASAQAQQVGDPSEGRKIATSWCANCHRIEPGNARQKGDLAPAWPEVANLPSTTSLSLHAFLMTPHGRMPDFILTPKQMDDVVAYILSLKSAPP